MRDGGDVGQHELAVILFFDAVGRGPRLRRPAQRGRAVAGNGMRPRDRLVRVGEVEGADAL